MSEFDNVDKTRLEKLANDMYQEMEKGLSGKQSSLLMLPTYIHTLPNGSESGNFLALDFGGSTFRVILVKLIPNSSPVIKSTTVCMESRMKTVGGQELFEHLADCVASFMKKESLENTEIPLGFTFSFPMQQSSLCYGTLVRWTKGFSNSDVVDKNVAELLNKALAKNEVTKKVKVVALANDTAGTLVSGCSKYANCHSGLILGTGTNAAYTEKVSNVPNIKSSEEMVVINMEWGNFGELGHLADLQTDYDKQLDASSVNAGKQLYEKMISGMYLGELTRLALLKRTLHKNCIFAGNIPDMLHKEDSLDGSTVSDCINSEEECRAVFPKASPADIAVVRQVCNAVSNRAAKLAAAGVYAIWLKREKVPFTVAVDGSVFLKHATFANVMRSTLQELNCTVNLEVATDGSGLGSALIAAIA
ncbi:hexokinase-1-like [Bolinopsis microptera]|uniref:hexokinase-1-like n=1 Tax=Bolinopsis microptera TaxID=2820187 RepID=UPI00307AEFFC